MTREGTCIVYEREDLHLRGRRFCIYDSEDLHLRERRLALTREKTCRGEREDLPWRERRLAFTREKTCIYEREDLHLRERGFAVTIEGGSPPIFLPPPAGRGEALAKNCRDRGICSDEREDLHYL